MIYAIGAREKYLPKLAAGPVYKAGRQLTYEGSTVWETEAAARAFIERKNLIETHLVLALDADWQTDTEHLKHEPYNRLLRHALIVMPTDV
jgi:hypothetical protein